MTTHLQDYTTHKDIGLCGEPGRTMSHHELKRGRITCAECIAAHAERERSDARARAVLQGGKG